MSPWVPSPKLNLISVLAKLIFRSTSFLTSVAVECIWTACFVILNLSRSFAFARCPGLNQSMDVRFSFLVLSLFSLGVGAEIQGTGAQIPFLVMEICCWALTGLSKYRTPKMRIQRHRMNGPLAAAYASLIVLLSIFTATTIDNDVWFRDITSSPSPFPLADCLYATKLWFSSIHSTPSRVGSGTTPHLPHCLPRCSCKEKITPPSPPMALPPLGIHSDRRFDIRESMPSIVPGVRVPTALERQNSIFVGLEV